MDGGIRSNEAGAFDMQRPQIEHQPTSDTKSEDSENIEEDVNICDICGDAGEEEKLVICTRCGEGAEHTYCMPIKLNKFPEGDWLCEGCQMKDKSKIQNANKSVTAPAASEVPCLGPKLDPGFCGKAKGVEAEWTNKEPGSQKKSDGKNTRNAEISSLASKLDTRNGSGPPKFPNIPSTGENVGLSNENSSSVLDVQKVNASRCQMKDKSKIQNANKSVTAPAASEVPCLGPKLDPGFCGNAKGVEAEWANKEPGSQKKSDGKNTRNAEISSLASKIDTINGSGPPNIPSTGENVGFSNENSSSVLDVQKVNASTSAAQNSEPVYRAQISLVSNPLSMKSGIQFSRGPLSKSASFNSRMQQNVKQLTGPAPSMRKMVRGNVQSSTSREGLISKLGKSASCKGMHSSYSNVESTSKVRSVLHRVDDKIGSKKVEERNITEERSFSTPDSETAVASEFDALAFNRRLEDANHLETTDDKENSRFDPYTTNTGKPQSVPQVGPLSVPRESNFNSSLAEAPVLARDLVIPEMEFIWQGDFDVLKAGRHPELCDRMQAHLSSCASPKVLEVAAKFPYRIEVDEVPRLSSWPLTFRERSPREDNIALFFFAKDNESYEKNYRNLVDNMLENDLALIGSIDGLELLIFPSNVLPKDSQRWNGSFFLWAVIRGRTSNSLKPFTDSLEEKSGGSTSIAVSLPAPLFAEVSTSPKSSINANHNKESSTFDQSFDKKAANIDADSDPRKNASPVDAETSSDLKEGVEASGNEEEQRLTKAEAVTYTDTQGGVLMDADPLSWKPSLNRKRAHTLCLTLDRQHECTGEATQSSKVESFSFGLVDVESKKKMKIEAQRHSNWNPREESSSGKSISSFFGERERSVGFQVARLDPISSFLSGNKLSGSNYEDWKRILMIVLRVGKYDAALNFPKPPLPTETAPADVMLAYKDWLDSDEMCKCYIVASLQTVLQKQVERLKTAREMMLYLKEMFEGKSRLSRYLTVRALVSTKMAEGSAVRDHMLKMFGYAQELASYDVILDAELQTDIFLASLSGAFEGFVTNFNINGLKLTNSELLAALQTAEDGMKAKGQVQHIERKRSLKPKGGIKRKKPLQQSQKEVGESSKTLEAKTKRKGKCFSCGKKGHWKTDCQVAKAKLGN